MMKQGSYTRHEFPPVFQVTPYTFQPGFSVFFQNQNSVPSAHPPIATCKGYIQQYWFFIFLRNQHNKAKFKFYPSVYLSSAFLFW